MQELGSGCSGLARLGKTIVEAWHRERWNPVMMKGRGAKPNLSAPESLARQTGEHGDERVCRMTGEGPGRIEPLCGQFKSSINREVLFNLVRSKSPNLLRLPETRDSLNSKPVGIAALVIVASRANRYGVVRIAPTSPTNLAVAAGSARHRVFKITLQVPGLNCI